ncbi:RNA-binding protein like [Quillaja saponaria]|nr:RNA-binding protein like [Quillaja saponaria]
MPLQLVCLLVSEMHDYIEQDDDRAGPWALKDTGTIGSAYDCYLQSAQLSSFTTGEASAHRGVGLVRAVGGGMPAHTMTDLSLMVLMGSGGPDLLPNRGGDPLILCFVDFASPACASTALSALQGYKMDEINPECNYLGLQFSRYPGSRSGPGSRGKR